MKTLEEQVDILDVKLEGLFNDAVRQCLRFVRKEQTVEEMYSELESLNSFGLKLIKQALLTAEKREREKVRLRIQYDKRKGVPVEETLQDLLDSFELKNEMPTV